MIKFLQVIDFSNMKSLWKEGLENSVNVSNGCLFITFMLNHVKAIFQPGSQYKLEGNINLVIEKIYIGSFETYASQISCTFER